MGPAPTASPGLSQSAISPASTAAASGGSAVGAPGMSVVPASFTEDRPVKINAHAQLAVDTVKALIPGVAVYPGLSVAAAVVQAVGGVPQVVITTNEGTGYLPEGCFLPPGVLHAFSEIDTVDFDFKWMGWVDPARILIDYMVTCEHRGQPVELLGLASSVSVRDDTKNMFPQVVPNVTPDAGAKPLGAERGNRHRLQVLVPAFYDELGRAEPWVRQKAARGATHAAMRLGVAAPLVAPGAPWHVLNEQKQDLSAAQWSSLREDYDQRSRIVGAMRPGFASGGRSAEITTRYQQAFCQLRALETLLGWQEAPDVSPEDVIYAAYQAGIDLNALLQKV